MIDFETLGVSRDSVLLSVGVVVFSQTEGELMKFYTEFDVLNQIALGKTIDKSTVNWWNRTDYYGLRNLLYNTHKDDVESFLTNCFNTIQQEYKVGTVWSRGYMDFDILTGYIPFPFWIWKDVRTLDVFGVKMPKNNHNALDDALNQVAYVRRVVWNVPYAEDKSTPDAV